MCHQAAADTYGSRGASKSNKSTFSEGSVYPARLPLPHGAGFPASGCPDHSFPPAPLLDPAKTFTMHPKALSLSTPQTRGNSGSLSRFPVPGFGGDVGFERKLRAIPAKCFPFSSNTFKVNGYVDDLEKSLFFLVNPECFGKCWQVASIGPFILFLASVPVSISPMDVFANLCAPSLHHRTSA